MTYLVIATLIGVFLTPSGIVVGADTARRVADGSVQVSRKILVCGPRSIAVLNGASAMFTERGGRRVLLDSHDVIAETCKSLKPSQSVRTQALEIAQSLAQDATKTRLPERTGVQSSGFLQRLIVVGYDDGKPAVFATEIVLSPSGAEFIVGSVSDLISQCWTFSGSLPAVTALMNAQSPILPSQSARPEVTVVREARLPCLDLSPHRAEAFFRLAVDVSRDFAADFDMPPGGVNWPIDFTILRPSGVEAIRREGMRLAN